MASDGTGEQTGKYARMDQGDNPTNGGHHVRTIRLRPPQPAAHRPRYLQRAGVPTRRAAAPAPRRAAPTARPRAQPVRGAPAARPDCCRPQVTRPTAPRAPCTLTDVPFEKEDKP